MSRTAAVHTGTSSLQALKTTRTMQQKQQGPNRFTASFSQMKEVCPDAIKTYASCVLDTDQSSPIGVTKHSCSKEFLHVKECFRKVRGF